MVEHDIWTVKAALDWTVGYLERKGDENPRLSAEWLIGEACGLRRIELYTGLERPLSLKERDTLRDYVSRRGRGEPLQYITGEVAFRHVAVKVRPGVLIPRPETEVLVSEALALLPAAGRPRALDSRMTEAESEELLAARAAQGATEAEPSAAESSAAISDASGPRTSSAPSDDSASAAAPLFVADLCTGSGCIACSIAYEHPRTRVIATDIAPEAVALARENVDALGLSDRVRVVQCDLGQGVPASAMGRLDLVVSNPPYVPASVLSEIPREVADFEPLLALDGGEDGLDVLRRLLPWCARALKPGGGAAFELHETRLDEAAALARAAGFEDARVVPDLAGRPRVLTVRKPVA